MHRPRTGSALLLLGALLSGCGEGGGASAGPVVRDSAGIRIVESTAPLWAESDAWRISPQPVLEIGEAEGASAYLLSRVMSARRTRAGTIVLANTGSQEIRFYDADGRHLRSAGRAGGGPGEFNSLAWIHLLPGDSILAYDFQARRLSIFAPGGEFIRSFQLGGSVEQGFPQVSEVLDDGSLLVQVGRSFRPGEAKDGLSRAPITFLHFSALGEPLDTIAVLLGPEAFVKTQGQGLIVTSPLFGRSPVRVARGDRVILGANDAYELGVYTPQGTLERLIRRRQDPRPVTAEAFETERRKRIDALDAEWRPRIEPMYAEIPRPATMPFYSGAEVDDEGNLWIQEFQAPGDPHPLWTVFDTEGRMLGSVAMPERFRPMHIGRDFVLGVWRDELDVERVQMYALEKPE